MIWLICGIGGLTALSLFFICVWSKWTKEAVEAGAVCIEPTTQLSYEEQEDCSHLWEIGECRECRCRKEIYLPESACASCMWRDFNRDDEAEEEETLDSKVKRLASENVSLIIQIKELQAQVKFLGSNPFGD